MAYELINKLEAQGENELQKLLASYVTKTESLRNQKHIVFQPSFDGKECFTVSFMKQKADYIHWNPCKAGLANLPEDYPHSSATYYYSGKQGKYPVITYMELQDMDLICPIPN